MKGQGLLRKVRNKCIADKVIRYIMIVLHSGCNARFAKDLYPNLHYANRYLD